MKRRELVRRAASAEEMKKCISSSLEENRDDLNEEIRNSKTAIKPAKERVKMKTG